jgi:hypothetical protein
MQAQIFVINFKVTASALEAFEASIKNTPINQEWGLFHVKQVCETIKALFEKLETEDKLSYLRDLENRALEAGGQETEKLLHLVQALTSSLNESDRFRLFLANR